VFNLDKEERQKFILFTLGLAVGLGKCPRTKDGWIQHMNRLLSLGKMPELTNEEEEYFNEIDNYIFMFRMQAGVNRKVYRKIGKL